VCGRYTLTTPGDLIAELFELAEPPETIARYNIAPTQEVATVRGTGEGGRADGPERERVAGKTRELALLRWGLVPHWADDPSIGNRMINARAETAAEKPAFRTSFKRKRCLILADGFYEWQKLAGGTKQPWYFRLESAEPFAFAGLWARWKPRDADGEQPIDSCTILTTEANELVGKVHHRMPVILAPDAYDLWLDPDLGDREPLEAVLGPFDPEKMIAYPVSTRVNSPANDDPRVIEPIGDADRAEQAAPGGEQGSLF